MCPPRRVYPQICQVINSTGYAGFFRSPIYSMIIFFRSMIFVGIFRLLELSVNLMVICSPNIPFAFLE